MNICIYAFGSSPLFANEFIKKCKNEKEGDRFFMILESSHHLELISKILNKNDILCINEETPKYINKELSLEILKDYPSNINLNIESEKKTLKTKSSYEQTRIALIRYFIVKNFLKQHNIGHVLYTQHPENFNAIMIENIAKEIGIKISVPIHTRNLDTSFFSSSCQEKLPKCTFISEENRKKALEFHNRIKESHVSSGIIKKEPFVTDIFCEKKSFKKRIKEYLNRFLKEKNNREFINFYVAFLNNLPFYRDFIWGIRKSINKKLFNLSTIDDLPEKFIFYPLQYSPESSINIPAPFFIDQMRIIDALRFSMPNDMKLVIKEHPSCIELRDGSFVKNLLKKSGVMVAKYDLDSREIIKKSAITVSVSGTAAWEAFLLNKPSFIMSETFFDKFIGGVKKIENLEVTILEKLSEDVDDQRIQNAIAEVYSVTSKFYGITAIGHGRVMMTRENLDNFTEAFYKKLEMDDK